ncbi:MAG TPA: hypothetical protein ENN67_04280, partial [Firmicutes bacterium]|nr:hypothetical protein [Bacillota bacterium]
MNTSDTKTGKIVKVKKTDHTKGIEPRAIPKDQSLDLCSTCAEAPTCIHRSIGKPVHDCSEYES